MDQLFGISMNLIMYALLALLAVALGSVTYVALRNRVMFNLGIRNLPRRRAQTTLIVVGLMLSTVIIAAAFTTGDTVSRSITSEVYSILGSVDEVLQLRVEEDSAFEDPTLALLLDQTFPEAAVAPLIATLKTNPTFDYIVPAYSSIAVAINPEQRLSSPDFTVIGLDPAQADGLPDIETLGGQRLSISDLGPNEIYLNESAADEINIAAGQAVTIVVRDRTAVYRVREVVKDRRLAGSGGISILRQGGVMSLAAVQELFQAPGMLTMIAVSNDGDSRAGYKLSARAEADLNAALASARAADPAMPQLAVATIKDSGVSIAEFGANILTTFFLVFGLFSIGAGVLLIFLIFVMLAAERKSEMGMSRAVGTRRLDIVQTFLSEGMAYNVGSALVGAALGVLVAFGMSQIMAQFFAQADINISPHVTPRSLIISYSLGVVLTFLTVTFASWRVSNINIVRAIRDIPEPPTPKPLWRARGFLPTLKRLVFKPASLKSWLSVRLGGFIASIGVLTVSSGVESSVAQSLLGVLGSLMIVGVIYVTFQISFLLIIVGIAMTALGAIWDNTFLLLGGLSITPLGLALAARSFGANERIVFTSVGLLLIYIWELDFQFKIVETIFGETEGDIELFFLSGVMVTVAATFVVVFNSDIILGPLTKLGKLLGKLLPSLKMAIAYPLANRARTGMTMAMFCLVVFALTVMSSMNHNFNRLYLSDSALGGWDIQVDENPNNPIADLRAGLVAAQAPVVDDIEAIGVASVVTRFSATVCEERAGRDCSTDADEYTLWGNSPDFLTNASIPLQARAHGYADAQSVWQALASDPTLAIVDSAALLAGGFGQGFISGIRPDEAQFEPVNVQIRNRFTGQNATLKVIGIIQAGASSTFPGMHMSQAALQNVFPAPDARRFFVRTASGTNNVDAARAIESTLLTSGAQAESLRQRLNELTSVQTGFFYLLQGFMGLGLLVGVAAVGVIAFRTVVERRQQIGMLRAIGYTRSMIGMTFMLESAFIAFMGVLSGVVFALILAWQLIEEEFANQGITSFSVPWLQVALIAAVAFGFALLMTLIPSRQAARIPIAQALRYE